MKIYLCHIPPIDFWTGGTTRSELCTLLVSGVRYTDQGDDERQKWSAQTGWDSIVNECSGIR